MDVTEMNQKPTSSGVRNKQKQNKALAFRWKAIYWVAKAGAQGQERGGQLGGGDTASGGTWRRYGAKAVLAPLLPQTCLHCCPGGPVPRRGRCPRDTEGEEREALTSWPRNG